MVCIYLFSLRDTVQDTQMAYLGSESPLTTASRSACMHSLFGDLAPCFLRPPTRRVRSGHRWISSPTASGLQLRKAASSSGLYNSLGTHLSQPGDELWSLTTAVAQRLNSESTIGVQSWTVLNLKNQSTVELICKRITWSITAHAAVSHMYSKKWKLFLVGISVQCSFTTVVISQYFTVNISDFFLCMNFYLYNNLQ